MTGTASWPIAVRVGLSGLVGVVASVLFFLCEGAAAGRVPSSGFLALDGLRLVAAMMLLVALSLFVAGPLILIAMMCGVLLRREIERHLLAWTLAAPVIVWLFACMIIAVARSRPEPTLGDVFGGFVRTMADPDNLLTLGGASVAGVAFHILSAGREERPDG